MEEIKELIKRIDFRWGNSFMDEDEYLQKRRELQLEIESLRPVEHDELLKIGGFTEELSRIVGAMY
jgi:hypothetical protein